MDETSAEQDPLQSCLKFSHPSSLAVYGSSSSGKTFSIVQIVQQRFQLYTYPLKKTFYILSEQSTIPEELRSDENVEFIRGFPASLDFLPQNCLCVIDDLQNLSETSELARLFTILVHHKRVSAIVVFHNLFFKNARARDIALSANYMLIKKNPRDPSQVFRLAQQIRPDRAKQIYTCYLEATKQPYSDFLIDNTQTQREALRFRSKILTTDPYCEVYCTPDELRELQHEFPAEE